MAAEAGNFKIFNDLNHDLW